MIWYIVVAVAISYHWLYCRIAFAVGNVTLNKVSCGSALGSSVRMVDRVSDVVTSLLSSCSVQSALGHLFWGTWWQAAQNVVKAMLLRTIAQEYHFKMKTFLRFAWYATTADSRHEVYPLATFTARLLCGAVLSWCPAKQCLQWSLWFIRYAEVFLVSKFGYLIVAPSFSCTFFLCVSYWLSNCAILTILLRR